MNDNTIQITPFMHVADLEAAVRFFTEVLDFRCSFRMRDYAYVEREGAGIRILAHDDPRELGTPHGGFACYIDAAISTLSSSSSARAWPRSRPGRSTAPSIRSTASASS